MFSKLDPLQHERFIDDIFLIWDGPRETLLELLSDVNTKEERIKKTYKIRDSKISFLDLLLFKDSTHSTLQCSTFQKPLNKYWKKPFESFHPTSNRRAFIKGELMLYARNSSTFTSFVETRALFGSAYAFGDTLLSFYYPCLGRSTIATGLGGSRRLIGYLHKGEWCSSRIMYLMGGCDRCIGR